MHSLFNYQDMEPAKLRLLLDSLKKDFEEAVGLGRPYKEINSLYKALKNAQFALSHKEAELMKEKQEA
ncbi:MAG: hypothetical protein EOO16_07300 [Chitinophagaceae bacterium]|nr:MAG: hypothetical protein EOO16_07300 [Chitinophagaceae bacterium]